MQFRLLLLINYILRKKLYKYLQVDRNNGRKWVYEFRLLTQEVLRSLWIVTRTCVQRGTADGRLPWRDAVSLSKYVPTFRKIVVRSSSRSNSLKQSNKAARLFWVANMFKENNSDTFGCLIRFVPLPYVKWDHIFPENFKPWERKSTHTSKL